MSTLQDMRPMPGPGSAFVAQPKKFEKTQQVQILRKRIWRSFREECRGVGHSAGRVQSGVSASHGCCVGGVCASSLFGVGGVELREIRLSANAPIDPDPNAAVLRAGGSPDNHPQSEYRHH